MLSNLFVMPVTFLCYSLYPSLLPFLPSQGVLAPTAQPTISRWLFYLRWVVLGVQVAHL